MKPILIAPSILSADFAFLQKDIEMVNQSEADWFHVDIMDGIFVPNISFGFPVMKALAKHARKPLDVHLMIQHPENYLKQFRDAGATRLTIHIELGDIVINHLQEIKSLGMKAGLAVNPGTPVAALNKFSGAFDQVILMSVEPGFGGQSFIPNTFEKLRDLKSIRKESNQLFVIEIDGGVTLANAPDLIEAGADILVAGNTVFAAANPVAVISKLKAGKK